MKFRCLSAVLQIVLIKKCTRHRGGCRSFLKRRLRKSMKGSLRLETVRCVLTCWTTNCTENVLRVR